MKKTILKKLALERCGFYLSQLLAHVHLADGMPVQTHDLQDDVQTETCIYTIVSAMQADLKVLESLIEET